MRLLPEELFYKELDAKDFLRNYIKHSVVSISGGKDSLVALDLSYRIGIKKFVFGNTSMTFPKTEEYIRKLENFYEIEIIQVKPPRNFFDLVDDIGFPSQRLRWCCEVYKFGPLANYVLRKKIKYMITGIRSEESRKRRNYSKVGKNPLIPAIQINPILDWSIEEVWEYIKYYKLPYHPLYDMGYNRLGCWMCPFQNEGGFKRLHTIFPNLYEALNNSLYKNIKKFGKVGVRDIDNYIKEHAWTKNALPIRNIIEGSIEYKKNKDSTKFIIKCSNRNDFLKILRNSNLLKGKSLVFSENKKNFTLTIISKILNIYKVLIHCERQINCVGCGACRSLCSNGAINIENSKMSIDFSKCSFCLECLSTTKLRAGCIARNYAPIRKKFEVINLKKESMITSNNLLFEYENKGLIKTRKNIPEIQNKIEEFFQKKLQQPLKFLKINGVCMYSTQEMILNIRKEKGFTHIYINSVNEDVEEKINFLINIFKN